jgi:hypothetical protein
MKPLTRWTYATETHKKSQSASSDDVIASVHKSLQQMGSAGWELVSLTWIDGRAFLVFKQPDGELYEDPKDA